MLCLPLLASALAPGVSRRAALSGAAAISGSFVPLSARAFDLPALDEFENPVARAKYAGMKNPDLTKQQSLIFYAITVNDISSIQAMADGGWALTSLQDSAGKTPLHRAAQVGNTAAGDSTCHLNMNLHTY